MFAAYDLKKKPYCFAVRLFYYSSSGMRRGVNIPAQKIEQIMITVMSPGQMPVPVITPRTSTESKYPSTRFIVLIFNEKRAEVAPCSLKIT
jgi:hypothetical protein